MKPRLRPLELAVLSTSALLLVGAALAALAVFDEALGWDILGAQIEAVLRGVLLVSVIMGVFGVAVSVVLGIHELVAAVRSIADGLLPEAAPRREAPARAYARPVALALAALALAVVGLSAADHVIRHGRDRVFRRLAAEQLERFGPRIGREAARLPLTRDAGSDDTMAPALSELVLSLEELSFVAQVQVLMPDPHDEHALWRYSAAPGHDDDRLERVYVAKDEERAVVRALAGDSALLEQLDARMPFVAHAVVCDDQGMPRAVVRLEGDRREDFRDYSLADDEVYDD